MPTKWISHVKDYAKEHNLTYGQALKEAKASYVPEPKLPRHLKKGGVHATVEDKKKLEDCYKDVEEKQGSATSPYNKYAVCKATLSKKEKEAPPPTKVDEGVKKKIPRGRPKGSKNRKLSLEELPLSVRECMVKAC